MVTARSEWETVPSLLDSATHTSEGIFWQKTLNPCNNPFVQPPNVPGRSGAASMAFLLRGRKMGRRNITENGLHLLCPSSFGRESDRNLVSLTTLSLNLFLTSLCSLMAAESLPVLAFLACMRNQKVHTQPLAHGPGLHSLRNTDPVAKTPDGAQGNTQKMVFLAQQSQDLCVNLCRMLLPFPTRVTSRNNYGIFELGVALEGLYFSNLSPNR